MDEAEIKAFGEVLISESIIHAVKHYGIEGCKEAIQRVYPQGSKIRDKMLTVFHKIYNV